jgi:hypothetical protein
LKPVPPARPESSRQPATAGRAGANACRDAPLVRLATLNVLDRVGPKAAPALPVIRRASMQHKDFVADYVNRMVQYVPAWIEQGERESDQE